MSKNAAWKIKYLVHRMDYWNKVPVPTFPKEGLATRMENEEKLAAVQMMIPTKDLSHSLWHFSDFSALFSHSCEIPQQLMSHSQSKTKREKMSVFCNKRIIHSGSAPNTFLPNYTEGQNPHSLRTKCGLFNKCPV